MITHIVPLFAPVIDGVGDYALHLARELRERFGQKSRFVVCDPAWRGSSEIDGFNVAGPTGFSQSALAPLLSEAQTILVHYVGYAYDPNGAPAWLIQTLNANPGARIFTVFHEIWSSGPPWRKVFYAAGKQKRLAAELLKISAHAFTSTIWMCEELERLHPGRVTRVPIPGGLACAAEPLCNPRSSSPWRALLFGQSWTRLPAVKKHRPLLESLLRRGALEAVFVLGKNARPGCPDIEALQEFLPPEMIRPLGEVAETDGAEAFANADFYLSPHSTRDACKSSALMSAFNCGCPVVLSEARNPSPLVEGQHFLSAAGFEANAAMLPAIARTARQWYLANADWPIIADKIGHRLASDSVVSA